MLLTHESHEKGNGMLRAIRYLSLLGLLATAVGIHAQSTTKIPKVPKNWDVITGAGRSEGDTDTPVQKAQADAQYFVIERQIPGSNATYELHFVLTRDEIYTPVGIRKPKGKGPFPVILISAGDGYDGVAKVERMLRTEKPMMDRMIARGYAVASAGYRNEIPKAYNSMDRSKNTFDDISGGGRTLKSTPTLDSDDYISLIQHLQVLPWVRKNGVGTFGVSHSGELMMKAASVIDFGAAVSVEGAAHEFLAVDTDRAPRGGPDGQTMMLNDEQSVARLADKEKAMARIRNIHTPFLHLGRDQDHLQGIFRTVHEWMLEAGKNSRWISYDHYIHGYAFGRNAEGVYAPDEVQEQSFQIVMAFFDKYLKGTDASLTPAAR